LGEWCRGGRALGWGAPGVARMPVRARRFVRERGASERGLAPAAWEDGGSAVLQVGTPVVMLMAGLQIARRLFAGRWVPSPRGGRIRCGSSLFGARGVDALGAWAGIAVCARGAVTPAS
jgi:hypothetical protein